MARMLRDLTEALGADLCPVHPVPAPRVPVSAVHISELADPTPFLNGGELLMTTGMNLQPEARCCTAYVHRLVRAGVAGLVLGLGPTHDALPEPLNAATARAQLPLLIVPPRTPFLRITREFWIGELNEQRRAFRTIASAHRALVTAATGTDPVTAVLDTLARAIGGWAARLAASGELIAVCPPVWRDSAATLISEVTRQRATGGPAAATFPLGNDDVILYPLTDRDQAVGFLAAAAPRPVREPVRQLALTAAALLNVTWARERDVRSAARRSAVAVVELLQQGRVDAALVAARSVGIALPGRDLRVAVVAGTGDEADRVWDAFADDTAVIASARAGDQLVLLLAPGPLATGHVKRTAAGIAGLRVAISAAVPLDGVPNAIATTLRAVDDVACDAVEDFAELGGPLLDRLATPALQRWAEARVAPLADYARIDLVPTIVEYLRRRGSAEAAARAQNLHRHTLKYRIARAGELLQCDLTDPDAAAEIWLVLRLRGLT